MRSVKDCQQREINQLSYELGVERENVKKLGETKNRMLLALENKNLFVGQQDPDDAVVSRFSRLISQIKTWSVPFAEQERPLSVDGPPHISGDLLHRVLPNLSRMDLVSFLQKSKNVRLFVRGWVSLSVTDLLFRSMPDETNAGPAIEDAWVDRDLAQAIHLVEMRLYHAG